MLSRSRLTELHSTDFFRINILPAPLKQIRAKINSIAAASFIFFNLQIIDVVSETVPVFEIDNGHQRMDAAKVAFAWTADSYTSVAQVEKPQGALGRSHWKLEPEQLEKLRPFFTENPSKNITASSVGFDLWDVIAALGAPPGTMLIASLNLRASNDKTVILGLGCADEAFVRIHDRTIFATIGDREYVRTENLVSLNLHKGDNLIKILCRKSKSWKSIPEFHNDDQWYLGLEIYDSPKIAWDAFRSRNFHLADSPIVEDLKDIRIESTLPDKNYARIFNLDGQCIDNGAIDSAGAVSWANADLPLPFAGFLQVGDHDTEAIVVTGKFDIETTCAITKQTHRGSGETDAWSKRVVHLLDPEFSNSRNINWARKLALSLVMDAARSQDEPVNKLLRTFKSADIAFRHYNSSIDGTRQYFRIYQKSAESARIRPIVLMLPPVNSPVKPYLETSEVANLHDTEDVASLASEYDLVVVWPGIVDVDYGGEFARVQLDECIDEVKKELNRTNAPFFLLGSCSSGVTAIGYAETRKVAGLLLQSPVIQRPTFRWLSGLNVDEIAYPNSVLDNEDTGSGIDFLANIPVYLTFNTQIPGHGERLDSISFCKRLESLHADIEQYWPPADKEFEWGERQRLQLAPMFEWISKRNAQSVVSNAYHRQRVTNTVKSSLLKGFVVNCPKDDSLNTWFQSWGLLWASFRGQPWSKDSIESKIVTRVTGRVLEASDIASINAKTFLVGTSLIPTDSSGDANSQDELWGFRLLPGNSFHSVEVFRSERARNDFPKIDLVVDGCCKGAVWKRINGDWVLIEISI